MIGSLGDPVPQAECRPWFAQGGQRSARRRRGSEEPGGSVRGRRSEGLVVPGQPGGSGLVGRLVVWGGATCLGGSGSHWSMPNACTEQKSSPDRNCRGRGEPGGMRFSGGYGGRGGRGLAENTGGEFDPGSGSTLAACLMHASRTGCFRALTWRTGEEHVGNLS